MNPPDFVAQTFQQIRLVRCDEDGCAGAAKASQTNDGAGADDCIVLVERMVEREQVDRGGANGILCRDITPVGRPRNFAGGGRVEPRGKTQELSNSAAFLSGEPDDRVRWSRDVEARQGAERNIAEFDVHVN